MYFRLFRGETWDKVHSGPPSYPVCCHRRVDRTLTRRAPLPAVPTTSPVCCASRVWPLDEQGSLEIVGRRTGNKKVPAKTSGPSWASSDKRNGAAWGSVAEVDASAVGDVAAKGAVEEAAARSREEEDGVMLGSSGELWQSVAKIQICGTGVLEP